MTEKTARRRALPSDQVLLFFSKPGMLVVAPLPDGSFRLVAEVDDAPEQPDVVYAQRLLNTRGPRRTPVSVTEVIWGSGFGSTSAWRTSTGPDAYCPLATPHIRTARQVGKA